ncbi:MAG: hypothetical protein AAGD25_29130 [Cyanobacteria bacterium P01_F01_bin.150]
MRFRNVLLRTSLWLTTEVLLNLMGLDNLADYSEFIFQARSHAVIQAAIVLTTST